MKKLYYFNLLYIFMLVISFFAEKGFAILIFIGLPFVQVLSSLLLLTKRNTVSVKNQKLLSIYFSAVFAWFILIAFASFLPNNLQYLAKILFPFPLIIAIYFVLVSYYFYRESHSINNKI